MRTVASSDEVFYAEEIVIPDRIEPVEYIPPTEAEMREMIADKRVQSLLSLLSNGGSVLQLEDE